MNSPRLLNPDGWASLPSPRFRAIALERFGELAASADLTAEKLLRAKDRVAATLYDEWNARVAEELLLAKRFRRDFRAELSDAFKEICPFGSNTLPLKNLAQHPAACAVIPLAGNPPSLAHVWVFLADSQSIPQDHSRNLEGSEVLRSIFGNSVRVFCVYSGHEPERSEFSGPSWQLGAALAGRAAQEDKQAVIKDLARSWMVTGAFADGKVERVGGIESKIQIRTERTWLFPEAHGDDLPISFKRENDYRLAATLPAAWSHITGQGTVALDITEQWPDGVEVMHSFSSPAYRSIIAAMLFCRPRKLVLWQSSWEKSQNAAQQVIQMSSKLRECASDRNWNCHVVNPPREIPSGDISQVEQALRNEIRQDAHGEKPIVFNITTGNLLMRYAAITLAQQDPTIWLVYRDADNKSYDFTLLRFRNGQPVTCSLSGALDRANVNWTALIRTPKEPNVDCYEDVWAEMNKKPENKTA